jgi:RHS repeat-associated protein
MYSLLLFASSLWFGEPSAANRLAERWLPGSSNAAAVSATRAAELAPPPMCLGGVAVAVTPCSTRTSTAGQVDSVTFTVMSTAATVQDYEFTCSVTSAVASCTPRATQLALEPDSPQYLTVVFTPSAANGSGRVSLRARNIADNDEATGWYDVTVSGGKSLAVQVTPDSAVVYPPAQTLVTQSFLVKNVGDTAARYALTLTCTGQILSCTRSADTVQLNPGSSTNVDVSFQSGALNTAGTARLEAVSVYAPWYNDRGAVHPAVAAPASHAVGVSGKGMQQTSAASATDSVRFAITNLGNQNAVTYALSRGASGSVTLSGSIPASVTLNAGEETVVYSKLTTQGAGTSGETWLKATRSGGSESDSGFAFVAVFDSPTPTKVVSQSPASSDVSLHHQASVRQAIGDIVVRNGGSTGLTMTVAPGFQSGASLTDVRIKRLPSGNDVVADTLVVAAGTSVTYRASGITTGAGGSIVRIVALEGTQPGAFADTARINVAAFAGTPTMSVPGDTLLVSEQWGNFCQPVQAAFYLRNGPVPAVWNLSAFEVSTPSSLGTLQTMIATGGKNTLLQAATSVSLEPNETRLVVVQGTLPDTMVATAPYFCGRVSGNGVTPKDVCGTMSPRPLNRQLSVTNGLSGNDTLNAEAMGNLNGTVQASVGDATVLTEDPYPHSYFVRAVSADDKVFKVTSLSMHQIVQGGQVVCPSQSWAANTGSFNFDGMNYGQPSPCLSRTFSLGGARGELGGRTTVEITFGHSNDPENRKAIVVPVRVIPRLVAIVGGAVPRVVHAPRDTTAAVEFAVKTKRAHRWNIRAFLLQSAIATVDSIQALESNVKVAGDSLADSLGEHETRHYRVFLRGGQTLGSSKVALIARSGSSSGSSDTVYVSSAVAKAVVAEAVMPGDQQPRSSCMTFRAGPGAAWQCGDIMVSHSTVPYVSRGKNRAVTLFYNSGSAAPRAAIPIRAKFPDDALPTKLRAVTKIAADTSGFASAAADTSFFDGAGFVSDWSPLASGGWRRIAPYANVVSRKAGVHWWEVSLTPITGGVAGTTSVLRGRLVLGNGGDARNAIGKGWQVAGVDRIFRASPNTSDSSVVIVEGDGTAKLFEKRSGVAGWQSPKGDFSHLRLENGYIVRRFINGNERWYSLDTTAVVRATTPFGTQATYSWTMASLPSDSTWRLTTMVDEAGVASRFFYDAGTGMLDSVRAPDLSGVKPLRLSRSGAHVTALTDPDGRGSSFTYAANGLMLTRTGRLGAQTVTFTWDSSYSARTAVGPSSYGYRGFRSQGFADGRSVGTSASPAPVAPDTAHVQFTDANGNRTLFDVDALGQPTRIIAPHGTRTTIWRNPGNALADSMYSRGITTIMTYDGARGLPLSTKSRWRTPGDSGPSAPVPPRDSTWTTYAYDTTSLNQLIEVRDANDVATRIFYTGPYRDSVKVANVKVAWFDYTDREPAGTTLLAGVRGGRPFLAPDTAAASRGMLKRVWERGYAHPYELEYGARGNVVAAVSRQQHARGLGERTTYLYDALGVFPVGMVNAHGDSTLYTFDAIRRVVATRTIGHALDPSPNVSEADAPRRMVRRDSIVFDDVGRLMRRLTPRPDGGWYESKQTLDEAGRVVSDCPYISKVINSSNWVCETSIYFGDRLSAQIRRNGSTHGFEYDSLNRVVKHAWSQPSAQSLNIPATGAILADTAEFQYDSAGMVFARNEVGTIERTYVGPYLRSETQSVRQLAPDSATFSSAYPRWTIRFRYSYDRTGRVVRREMGQPFRDGRSCMAPVDGSCVPDAQFVDSAGLDTAKISLRYAYDGFGRVNQVFADSWKRRVGDVLPARSFTIGYDDAGRWTSLTNSAASSIAASPYTMSASYDEDDQVLSFGWTSSVGGPEQPAMIETLSERDALGRPRRRQLEQMPQAIYYDALGQLAEQDGEWFVYDTAGAGHLRKSKYLDSLTVNPLGQTTRRKGTEGATTYTYDAEGNRTVEDQDGGAGGDVQYMYDGNGRLASRREFDPNTFTGTVSLYLYDALGRRVLASDSTAMKRGSTTRYFYEAAGPSAGEIAFTFERHQQQTGAQAGHATVRCIMCTAFVPGPMGPNHLLLSYRDPDHFKEVFHHQDRQFSMVGESYLSGKLKSSTSQHRAYGRNARSGEKQAKGYTGGEDGAGGLVFLRNRYYDPNTRQFTQGDPIGQAGGLNLYAYAANNPLLLSDPLGLSPFELEENGEDEPELLKDKLKRWKKRLKKDFKFGRTLWRLVKELSRDPRDGPPPPPTPPKPPIEVPAPQPPGGSGPNLNPRPGVRIKIPVLIPLEVYDTYKMWRERTPYTPEWWERCYQAQLCI